MMAQDLFLAWNTGGETEERQLRHLGVGMVVMEGRGDEKMRFSCLLWVTRRVPLCLHGP